MKKTNINIRSTDNFLTNNCCQEMEDYKNNLREKTVKEFLGE